MPKWKQEVITFKVDEELSKALRAIPNRSGFIRAALQTALGSVCPVCQGMGFLNERQRLHWDEFAKDHHLEECGECQTHYIACHCNGTHKPIHSPQNPSPTSHSVSAAAESATVDQEEGP